MFQTSTPTLDYAWFLKEFFPLYVACEKEEEVTIWICQDLSCDCFSDVFRTIVRSKFSP